MRACPTIFATIVMTLDSQDRLHAKQGRSTARVTLVRADPPLAVYLKRHFRLPWPARLAALVDPSGKHSPAAAEWAHLDRARALGINVPEVVAAGERIGPWARLQSFVMVAELSGCEAINELLPRLAEQLDARAFDALKRRVVAEIARITATLHAARVFHKDLYLCHFFLDRKYLTPGKLHAHRVGERCWPGVASAQDWGKDLRAVCNRIGGKTATQPDRPAPPQGTQSLCRLVEVERPWSVAFLDIRRRRHHRSRPFAILGNLSATDRNPPAALAFPDDFDQSGALSGAQPQAALKADSGAREKPAAKTVIRAIRRNGEVHSKLRAPDNCGGQKTMHLALNFQRVDPARGGAETYVADLCRYLVGAGHRVDLYAESWAEGCLPREVNVIPVKVTGRTKFDRISSFAKNSEEALRQAYHDCSVGFINTYAHDVIIPQGGVHQGSLTANARRFSSPLVRQTYVLAKHANPKSWLHRSIENKQFDQSRYPRVVAVSNMVKRHLEQFHHIPRQQIYVVPNAIDPKRLAVSQPGAVRCALRNRLGLEPKDLTGLFVGHN